MISLKKYIESHHAELLHAVLDAYRAGLGVLGESAVQVCRPAGSLLQGSLADLGKALVPETTPQSVGETEESIEAEIRQWGQRASAYLKQSTSEFKEILIVIARTAEVIGERDKRYAAEFQELTRRLESIATLEDPAEIRECLEQSTVALRLCLDRMVEDGESSLAQLRQEVGTYQARLADAEKLASQDNLTGLDNRRRVEEAVQSRLAHRQSFSLLMFDLNGFKQINDMHGHLTGDEVLRQFAAELRSAFRPLDVVGRWGGDEFVVLVDGGLEEANKHVKRVRQWVFGDYTIRLKEQHIRLSLSAAVGVAGAEPGDSLEDLVGRADEAMYRDKRRTPTAG